MSKPIISCIIPARDENDSLLKDLISSIKAQDFPQDQIEILVITEGDSEQAKAIGIRKAQGEICAMFCADNYIVERNLFKKITKELLEDKHISGIYPKRYAYIKTDNSLNRYFSLIGGNDPVCYYLGKNDRWPHVDELRKTSNYQPSYGCNGFFYKTEHIRQTNLDHYYPMDNAMEVPKVIVYLNSSGIWHRTADNLFTFLRKRYRYARDLYCDRQDRRWKMVGQPQDYWRLAGFIISTLSIIPCAMVSIRGFLKIRDWAWAWHWPVSFGILITYGLLVCRNLLRHRVLFQRSADQTVSKPVLTQ